MRDEVFRTVARRVPYLSVSDADDGDDWVSCAALIADPAHRHPQHQDRVRDRRRRRSPRRSSPRRTRSASRASRSPRTRSTSPSPTSRPRATAVRIDKPRPTAVAYLDARRPRRRPRDQLAHDLVGAHFEPFVAAVHDTFTVGERLLWGNVAAACAVAFRAVGDSDRARERGRGVHATPSEPWFDGRRHASRPSSPVTRVGSGTGRAAVCGFVRRTVSTATTAA